MQNATQKTRKIILGADDAKGYEIKKVLESSLNGEVTETYIKKDTYDFYLNSNDREKESMIHSFSGETNEILKSIKEDEEALKDIDTKLFSLHSSLEYAITLPHEKMYQEVKEAMQYINSMRTDNRENTHEKLNALFDTDSYSHPTLARDAYPNFEYKRHINLIDDAAEQLAKHYPLSFADARGAMEQALKEVETLPKYDYYRDSVTNKIDFKEVVLYARNLLTVPF